MVSYWDIEAFVSSELWIYTATFLVNLIIFFLILLFIPAGNRICTGSWRLIPSTGQMKGTARHRLQWLQCCSCICLQRWGAGPLGHSFSLWEMKKVPKVWINNWAVRLLCLVFLENLLPPSNYTELKRIKYITETFVLPEPKLPLFHFKLDEEFPTWHST